MIYFKKGLGQLMHGDVNEQIRKLTIVLVFLTIIMSIPAISSINDLFQRIYPIRNITEKARAISILIHIVEFLIFVVILGGFGIYEGTIYAFSFIIIALIMHRFVLWLVLENKPHKAIVPRKMSIGIWNIAHDTLRDIGIAIFSASLIYIILDRSKILAYIILGFGFLFIFIGHLFLQYLRKKNLYSQKNK